MRRRDQRGALTPAVIVMALGMLLLGGLVTDGGRQLNAKLAATSTAQEAARAGANMLDQREQVAVIDPEKATEAVEAYCTVARENDSRIDVCEVERIGKEENAEKITYIIQVRVTMKVQAFLFGIIGQNELAVDVTADASPIQAVKAPGEDIVLDPFTPTPDFPTRTIDPPTDPAPSPTSNPVPDEYTTEVCGVTTAVPLTIGISCSVTTTTRPPPPPPAETITTTVFSPYPTSVAPFPTP